MNEFIKNMRPGRVTVRGVCVHEIVAYVVAAATGTMSQFETVLKEAQESGKERVNMNGAFGRAMQEKWEEGKRNGERIGKKIPSLNMLKKGFDNKTVSSAL